MKTISISYLRQHWPEAEAALEIEGEILITRDSQPVAKLMRVVREKPTRERKRWNPEEHMKWLKKLGVTKSLKAVIRCGGARSC